MATVSRKKIERSSPVPQYLFVTHGKEIESILRKAVRDALRMHKLLGNPVATVKNEKVVLIPPEEIPID